MVCSLPDIRRSAVPCGLLELTFFSVMRFCLDLAGSHLGMATDNTKRSDFLLLHKRFVSVQLYLDIVITYHARCGLAPQ